MTLRALNDTNNEFRITKRIYENRGQNLQYRRHN